MRHNCFLRRRRPGTAPDRFSSNGAQAKVYIYPESKLPDSYVGEKDSRVKRVSSRQRETPAVREGIGPKTPSVGDDPEIRIRNLVMHLEGLSGRLVKDVTKRDDSNRTVEEIVAEYVGAIEEQLGWGQETLLEGLYKSAKLKLRLPVPSGGIGQYPAAIAADRAKHAILLLEEAQQNRQALPRKRD